MGPFLPILTIIFVTTYWIFVQFSDTKLIAWRIFFYIYIQKPTVDLQGFRGHQHQKKVKVIEFFFLKKSGEIDKKKVCLNEGTGKRQREINGTGQRGWREWDVPPSGIDGWNYAQNTRGENNIYLYDGEPRSRSRRVKSLVTMTFRIQKSASIRVLLFFIFFIDEIVL